MNVLDQVLAAEAEAAQTVQKAKDEATTMVADARTAQREALLSADTAIQAEREKALAEFQNQIDRKTQDVLSQSRTEVSAIERKFADANTDIVATITNALS